MSVNMLQKARENRVIALQTLERRRRNIFLLENPVARTARRGNSVVFIRRRETALLAAPANTPEKLAA